MEVDYLIRNKWTPCIEFELEHGFVYCEHGNIPGYYDGRYWSSVEGSERVQE
ncbi:unnamed protein product [Eruca vesicaria subsp. sativa]|uniref:Uncharacterized protein n=1 Tax=Eruca vesicaria subsp. sativa TaxID=29727 RepID=A0ABC8LHI3_ERUVS|nr:unnamed protein product [Eruca vesicaria subsp. sativa]